MTITLFETTINTAIFDTWIQRDLMPKLPPQSVIILDNATFHKGAAMKNAFTQAGHTLLYLLPCSPDLNPIEKKWAQAKALRRKKRCSLETLFTNSKL